MAARSSTATGRVARRLPSALAAGALLLTGCGSDGAGTGSSGDPSAADRGAADAKAVEPSAGRPGTARPTTAEPTDGVSPADPGPGGEGGEDAGTRGNVAVDLGESVVVSTDDGTEIFTIVVSAIDPAVACDSGSDLPPANGSYIALDVRVEVASALPPEIPYAAVSAFDFQVLGPDETTHSDVAGNGITCLSSSRTLPSGALEAGYEYAGAVVLDAPVTSGTVVFRPSTVPREGGWEWTF